MLWQLLLSVLLVVGCSVYALWSLMPAALRSRLQAALGIKSVAAAGCGGCDSCGSTPAKPGTPQVVRIVRRPPAS